MQMKRDTEYALRILYAVAGGPAPKEEPFRGGATLNDISALSGVPRIGIDRICGQLEAAGLIQSRSEEGGEVLYAPAPDLMQKSLLDITRATEQGMSLFAVFDKGSDFFFRNEARILRLQDRAETLLNDEKLGDYFS